MSLAAIKKKLGEIHDDLSTNVTHIYQREDLITAVDLVFHSVIRFKFRREWVQKGWVECLILGDTREGKSRTVQKLIEHYRAGEFCLGESTSYAGLMGGIQALGKRNTVTWGKLPLNDRRLVAVDEVSGMSYEQLAALSGIRSSGVAQITKILTEKTWARTRIIWISNPRTGRKLDTYNYGIVAVKELIGKAEDVSRLDFALTVANGEVSEKLINRGADRDVPHTYTSDLCSSLVLWAWTRRGEDVTFTPTAEEAILDFSEELGRKYTAQIPLVQPAEQRIKIARLCVALACRLFSTDDGKRVIIQDDHAEFIAWYLDTIYSKPSMGYNLFSEAAKSDGTEGIANVLMSEYEQMAQGTNLTEILLNLGVIKRMTLQEFLGWEREEVSKFMSWALRRGLVSITANGCVKRPVFTQLLKKVQLMEAEESQSDEQLAQGAPIVREQDDDSPF